MELPAVRDPSGMPDEEVLAGFCLLTLKDFLSRDNWIAWEQELRCMQHEWDKSWVLLAMKLLPQLVMARRLTKEEQGWYEE